MNSPIGPNEIRVVIRPVEARDYDLGPIPAELFKKTFDAFLTALQVTDRELKRDRASSSFLNWRSIRMNSGYWKSEMLLGNTRRRRLSFSGAAQRAFTAATTRP
jgi:hypothetical protein